MTFTHLQELGIGTRIANTKIEVQFAPGGEAMLGEPINVPTDTLIDLLFATLAGDVALTASDVTNIEQIQHELQKRGNERDWGYRTVN